jgi:hypothetical protein
MLKFTALALLFAFASAGPSLDRRQTGLECLIDPTVTAAVQCTLACVGGDPTKLLTCEGGCVSGLSANAQVSTSSPQQFASMLQDQELTLSLSLYLGLCGKDPWRSRRSWWLEDVFKENRRFTI